MTPTVSLSRPRDICFTSLCALTGLLSLGAAVLANAVIRQSDLFGALRYFEDDLTGETFFFWNAIVGAVLLLLALLSYLLSLDLFRSRRPYGRLLFLFVSLGVFPAVITISYNLDDWLVLWSVIGAVILCPFLLLGLERLAGATAIAVGRWCYHREWWEFAGMALRQGLRLFTTSRAARRDYGMTLRALGDVAGARAMMEPLYANGVRDEGLVEALCELAAAEKDWPATAERLEALWAKRPNDLDTLIRLARVQAELGRHESARVLIETVPEEARSPEMLALLAKGYRAEKNLPGALRIVGRQVQGLAYENARERYESLMKDFSEAGDILLALARLAGSRDKIVEEAKWLERMVERDERADGHGDDSRDDLRRQLIALYEKQGRPDKVIAHFGALVVGRDEAQADDIIHYCGALEEADRSEEAHELLRRHATRHADDYRFPLGLGRRLLEQGELEEAEARALEALELAHEDEGSQARWVLDRVREAVRLKDLEAAKRVADDAPDDVDPRLAYVSQLVANGRIEEAVHELDRLASRDATLKPRVREVALKLTETAEKPFLIYSYLSDLALKDGDFDGALDLYESMAKRSLHPAEIVGEGCRRILRLRQDYLPARAVLAQFHATLGEWPPVVEVLTPYFDGGGEHTQPLDAIMFEAMCKTDNLEGAVDYCDRLFERDAHNVEPLLSLAELYESRGRNNDATETLRQALNIDARNLAIYERLRKLEAKVKEERYFDLKEQLETGTDDPELHLEMGEIYMERGENIQAVKYFQIAARDSRLVNLCSAKQAACLTYRRLFDLAEEQLARVVVDPVGDPHVNEIKRLLYSIAATYEADQLLKQAFNVYKRIFRVDAGYRDVAQRIEELS